MKSMLFSALLFCLESYHLFLVFRGGCEGDMNEGGGNISYKTFDFGMHASTTILVNSLLEILFMLFFVTCCLFKMAFFMFNYHTTMIILGP